jgi:putative transposase
MSSYRRILYHLVFRTKYSRKNLIPEHSKELYAYLMGIIRNKHCFLYRINGMEDHLHILCELHPSIALADFMRDMKTSSSIWLKQSGKFPKFTGWADGYAA